MTLESEQSLKKTSISFRIHYQNDRIIQSYHAIALEAVCLHRVHQSSLKDI